MRNYTEQSYCNALKDQIQHVIGGLQPEPRNFFYDKSLLSFIDGPFAAAFVEETRNITSLICKESCFDSYGHGASLNSSDLNFIWGQDWPGHALRNPPIFWHRPLREADITKLIVATLQDDRLSIRAFLRALCESSGSLNDVENVERFLPKHDDVAVRAEDLAKGKKRIDILFEWGKGGAARVVVLEVKFGASAENPFDVYEEQAKIRLRKKIHPDKRNGDDFSSAIGYFFVIQHASSEREVRKKSCFTRDCNAWRVVYWQDLLRRWEEHLQKEYVTNIPDSAGASVRCSIFNKVYGGV